MKRRNSLDEIDRSILRILSGYEQLTALQLWYELGEDDVVKERVTEEEVSSRLDSLMKKGFVETVKEEGVDGDSGYIGYRIKMSTDVAGSEENGRGKAKP